MSRWLLLFAWVPLVAVLPIPDFWIFQLNYIGLYALTCMGLVLLTGVSGLTSVSYTHLTLPTNREV